MIAPGTQDRAGRQTGERTTLGLRQRYAHTEVLPRARNALNRGQLTDRAADTWIHDVAGRPDLGTPHQVAVRTVIGPRGHSRTQRAEHARDRDGDEAHSDSHSHTNHSTPTPLNPLAYCRPFDRVGGAAAPEGGPHGDCRRRHARFDAVIIGAGFSGLYMLLRTAYAAGCAPACWSGPTPSAAPGCSTATRAHAATSRASSTRTASPTRSSRSGCGRSRCPPSPRSRPTSTSSPTGWTCAATSDCSTDVVAMTFDEDAAAVAARDRGRRAHRRAVRRRGVGHPLGAAGTRHRRAWTPSRAPRCTPAVGPPRASTSPASASASSEPAPPVCN